MDYLRLLFIDHSALQAIIVLSLISAIGLMAGKVRILGISLGITFVFFAGILAGHFGLSIDPYANHKAVLPCFPRTSPAVTLSGEVTVFVIYIVVFRQNGTPLPATVLS